MLKIIHQTAMLWFKLKKFVYWHGLSTASVCGQPQRNTCVLCAGDGNIRFGQNVRLGFCPSPGYYDTCCHLDARGKDAFIYIGDGCVMNNNVCLVAAARPGESSGITIGKRCIIGPNFTCFNSNFHSVLPGHRLSYQTESVHIMDNVFIGANVMILKGVVLGKDCTVGAGSVVTKSFPAGSIIAGNPARLIRTLPSYIKDEQNHDC